MASANGTIEIVDTYHYINRGSLPVRASLYGPIRVTLPMPVFMPEHKFFVTPMEMGLRIAGQSEFAGPGVAVAGTDGAEIDTPLRYLAALFVHQS